MNSSKIRPPMPPPAHEGLAVPDFYCGEAYRAEESIGYLMRRILTVLGQSVDAAMCQPGSPTYPQWIPLHRVHMHCATTVAELARQCDLDTGAMTRLLDRLEAKGLCRRVRSVSDRRVVNIELTEEGRTAAEQVPHLLSRVHNEALAGFSRAEWEQLKDFLRRILANMQAVQALSVSTDNDNASEPSS